MICTILPPSPIPGANFAENVLGMRNLADATRGDPVVVARLISRIYRFQTDTKRLVYSIGAAASDVAIGVDPTTGVDDFIAIGARSDNSEHGRVYVLDAVTRSFRYLIESPDQTGYEAFGTTVVTVPDLDSDATMDILVGVPLHFEPPNWYGIAYLFSGRGGSMIRTIRSPMNPPYSFGQSVAGIHDLDDDGFGDYAVAGSAWSRVWVYSGRTGDLLHTVYPPVPESGGFGRTLAPLPDVDGDGRGELLIGSPYATYPGYPFQEGAAYVVSGRTGRLIRTLLPPLPVVRPQYNGPNFGAALSAIPDCSGDGRADIVVGAPDDCSSPPCPPTQIGRFYVFHSCAADFNYDGLWNSQDFFDFLHAFFQGWPGGDFDRSGSITSADFFAFLDAFFRGCP
ncbi:MAG: integrin alpha [Phycisphaerales bacterium]